AAIEKMKPSTLLGVPSYIYHLLREAKHRNVKMPYVKNIVLGASRITRTFKEKIASLLQEMGAGEVCVFGTYGFTEARSAWAECPTSLDTSSGYFLYPDKEIFEVVNPDTGEVLGEGESGELVYTSLDARGSVVLRYRTGDYVNGGITYEQCPHTKMMVPRISSDITRLSNVKELQLSKIKGTLVNLNNFEGTLNKFPEIDEWQVEIGKKDNDPHEMDVLKLYLTTSSTCNTEKLAEMVHKEVVATTEISPNTITFIPMEEMVKRLELETANKEKRILDSRPKE
ncbi:MAG: phenylacetate-CoA ligase, partial [Lysobacterales bacterium]